MRELSRQLNILLTSIKRQKDIDEMLTNYITLSSQQTSDTSVHIIIKGSIVEHNANEYELIASVVLVQDDHINILVDTGLGMDVEAAANMTRELSKLNVKPTDVHYVITTHGHPDHSGNLNLFTDATHYASYYVHYHDRFTFSNLFQNESESITSNVFLLKTPGHTSEDISVVVHNTRNFGTVAVAGDVFIEEGDSTEPALWRRFSANETQQNASRRKLICRCDYIIPGHGAMFRVTQQMKQKYNCSSDHNQ